MPVTGVFVSGFQNHFSLVSDGNKNELKGVENVAGALHGFSDEELCEKLRSGDQSALKSMMDRHAPAVLRLAMNVLSDRGEAEDVVQEVFISVWKQREAWIAGGAKFSTWLHRVTINKAIDKRRARRSKPEPVEFITAACDALAVQEADCEQAIHVDQLETSKKLKAEISRLPETQAVALRYFYFEGKDVAAIAAQMGSTEQAVRSLLKRGRQALRTRLMTQKKTCHDAFAIRSHDPHLRAHRR